MQVHTSPQRVTHTNDTTVYVCISIKLQDVQVLVESKFNNKWWMKMIYRSTCRRAEL